MTGGALPDTATAEDAGHVRHDVRVPVETALMVLAGGLLAGQARVNGGLSHRLGGSSADGILAALVSFSFGTVVVVAVLVIERLRRKSTAVAGGTRLPVRWWYCVGGAGGGALVAASAVAAPVIGVALLSVCTVAGQTAGSLAVDEVGLASGGRRPITRWRVTGSVVALAALAVGAIGHLNGGASPALYAALAGAGVLVAGQQAVNGRLREATGSAPLAATVSFAGGTLLLALAVGVAAIAGQIGDLDWPSVWWLYLGGAGGAAYIILGAMTVGRLGVLRLTLASVAGQLAGSVVLDVVAPAPGESLAARTVLSVVLTFLAVALAGRAPRGGPERAS